MKNYSSFSEIQKDLSSGLISCEKLVDHYLANAHAGKELNAFVELYDEEARSRAREIDQRLKAGTAGRLAGLVVGHKDVISYKDHGLQGASRILDKFVAQFDATVIERLLKEDAIIIGRQNCDEFAMGSTNETSWYGPAKNAADPTRVPGGSSGGSAVAVQADMCQISLGSDTGGSVRQPASFCGIVGLKPTYSRISRWGLIAYASSFDCIGIFGKSVEDVALVLEVIAGADEFDSTVSRQPVDHYSAMLSFSGKRKIAYLRDSVESEGVEPDIRAIMQQQIDTLKNQGHELVAIDLPLLEYALPTYYILTTAEASSNLSRYDGIRYGYRSPRVTDLSSLYKTTRAEGFGKEVKRRIMLGTFVLSASYYDAYYTKAQKVRRLIKNRFDELFSEYDFLLMPTSPMPAFKAGEFKGNPLAMYLADVFTVQANIIGVPAISVPAGFNHQGLPVGIQVMAGSFKEADLLAFSHYLTRLN